MAAAVLNYTVHEVSFGWRLSLGIQVDVVKLVYLEKFRKLGDPPLGGPIIRMSVYGDTHIIEKPSSNHLDPMLELPIMGS